MNGQAEVRAIQKALEPWVKGLIDSATRNCVRRKTVTVATALISFLNGVGALGDVCNHIDAVEQGYSAAASLSGPILLTPVWRVTTDTGAYQLDTVTGGVTRVS